MLGNFFKDTEDQQRAKYQENQSQILNLESEKKRLEIQVETMHLELKNKTLSLEMKLKEDAHKQKLSLDEERAKFEREKQIWNEEKQKLLSTHNKEMKEFKEKLEQEFSLKLLEATTLAKLDSEQKTKQSEIDNQRKISEIQVKHIDELSKTKSELNKEYYDRMTSAFQEIQTKGDNNSRFVQELALKIFDRVPTQKQQFALEFNSSDMEARNVNPSPA